MIYYLESHNIDTVEEINKYFDEYDYEGEYITLKEYDVVETCKYRATGTWLFYNGKLHHMADGAGY